MKKYVVNVSAYIEVEAENRFEAFIKARKNAEEITSCKCAMAKEGTVILDTSADCPGLPSFLEKNFSGLLDGAEESSIPYLDKPDSKC